MILRSPLGSSFFGFRDLRFFAFAYRRSIGFSFFGGGLGLGLGLGNNGRGRAGGLAIFFYRTSILCWFAATGIFRFIFFSWAFCFLFSLFAFARASRFALSSRIFFSILAFISLSSADGGVYWTFGFNILSSGSWALESYGRSAYVFLSSESAVTSWTCTRRYRLDFNLPGFFTHTEPIVAFSTLCTPFSHRRP